MCVCVQKGFILLGVQRLVSSGVNKDTKVYNYVKRDLGFAAHSAGLGTQLRDPV